MGRKAIRNIYAQPISPLAQRMYDALLKKNERAILEEADPKVTFVTDNNMQVAQFIALGGDSEDRSFQTEKFKLFGQVVEIPYEKVSYDVVDIATGKITKQTARYLDTKDTERVAELYKEFYRLAEFLITQEVAMKGLLPALTEKGEYIVDPKTGLPLVGSHYLEYYFGLTHAATPEERTQANAIADVQRWAHGSIVYQVKASGDAWKEIYSKLRTGEITKYGVGPALNNIGTTEFHVNNTSLNPGNYVSGATTPERATFEVNRNKNFRSDIANMLVSTQGLQYPQVAPQAYPGASVVGTPYVQPMVDPNAVQPSVQTAQPTSGPVEATPTKASAKVKK